MFHIDYDATIVGHMKLLGFNSMYTGACPTIFKRAGPIGWEDLVTRTNPMFTDTMKGDVRIFYGDYCGGPLIRKNKKQVLPEDFFSHFPNAQRGSFTMAKRQHDLLGNIDTSYSPHIVVPAGWVRTRTFDHGGVVVWVFDKCGDKYPIPVNVRATERMEGALHGTKRRRRPQADETTATSPSSVYEL